VICRELARELGIDGRGAVAVCGVAGGTYLLGDLLTAREIGLCRALRCGLRSPQ